jgi:hypothetical protein
MWLGNFAPAGWALTRLATALTNHMQPDEPISERCRGLVLTKEQSGRNNISGDEWV